MATNQDIVLKIRVLDPQGKFLSGKVDVRFEHTRLSERLERRGIDASQEIAIQGLRRGPEALYKVFVTLSDPFRQQAKFVNIPSSGFATLEFVFDQAGKPEEPETPEGDLVVRGLVRHSNGTAAPKLKVRAFDRDLRSETLLGEKATDDGGHYEIRYTADKLGRAEKGSADLVVRAFGEGGRELAVSTILFNAGREETVDLVVGNQVYRGPSEYEVLVEILTPLLEGLSFADLTEDGQHQDVSFLSGETGQDAGRITLLIVAHRLRKETGIHAEAFYGMFREGLPTLLPALLAQSPEVQRRALVRAAEANIIPPSFASEAGAVVGQLKAETVRQAMKPSTGDDGRATLNDLLAVALPDAGLREDFLAAYASHTGPVEDFWKKLESQPGFEGKIGEVQRTLQFGAIAGNHLPLVNELWRRQQADPKFELSDLATIDWLDLISRDGGNGPIGAPPGVPGKDEAERVQNYARAMSHMVEDAFPSRYLAHRLEGSDLPGGDDLKTFFTANTDFEIRSTRLRSYLDEHREALAGVRDPEGTTAHIQALQRVYRVAPRFEQASVLYAGGVDSAHAVTAMGETLFLSTYGIALGDSAQAKKIYGRAQQVEAMALNLFAEYGLPGFKTSTHAVPDQVVLEVEGVPEWSTLFGSLELCSCEHCRSVYSPAAYLVDVLHFLKGRRLMDQVTRDESGQVILGLRKKTLPDGSTAVQSAKDVLFLRRPDLGEIELTCENTNTPLPYVDLVTEALENAVVAPPVFVPFTLNPPAGTDFEADLNHRTVSANLRAAFHPRLSGEAVISIVSKERRWSVDHWAETPDGWTIDEPAFTYTIRREDGHLRVVARGLQTKGSAAERAASPQYVNADAYGVLSGAVYPWSLPFDLWAEEERACLGHLGVSRSQIMETLLPGERDSILEDPALAREHLGLTGVQADLITGAVTGQSGATQPGVWNLWGFEAEHLSALNSIPDPSDSTLRIAAGTWLNVLRGRVDVFLQQSGLKYKELLELLDTNHVGGEARTIRILSTDPKVSDTCETGKLRLDGFDPRAAARAVRFVRLARTLGWALRDLDRAVTAFAPADLDDGFLKSLSHVQRLHAALGVPVPRLLSWWAELDSDFYIDHRAPGQPRAASVYDELFRNRAVVNPPDPAFTEDPEDLTGTLTGHSAAITAALGVSAADVGLLLGNARVIPRSVADPAVPDDTLSLENLSRLHRHASLAKALRLPVRDYLTALALVVADPFATTTATLLFMEKVDKIRDAGVSFAELDYLLRHVTSPESPIAPIDEAIATLLDELRTGLQKIAEENVFRESPDEPTTDPDGDLTRRKLALLNWERALIDEAVATLSGTVLYETPLSSLPAGLTLPEYDAEHGVLRFSGPMTWLRKEQLIGIPSGDAAYRAAVEELYDAPRRFIRRAMRGFEVQDFATPLAALPDGVKIPATFKRKVYFDASAGRLHCQGVLSEPERGVLLALSEDVDYQNAVKSLYDQAETFAPKASDVFLTTTGDGNDASLLFDTVKAPEDRFLLVLRKLLPYLRRTLSERLAVQEMAEAVQLEVRSADVLLRTLASPAASTRRCLDELLAPAFAESSSNVQPTPKVFPVQFEVFLRVHKAALIVTRFKLTHRQLGWLFRYGAAAGWLDLGSLPVDAAKPAASFDGWLRLAELARLRDGLPQGEKALDELLELAHAVPAAKKAWLKALTRWTRWETADLEALLGAANDSAQTGHLAASFPQDYKDERLLVRLREVFRLLGRLKMPARLTIDLANNGGTLEERAALARNVRQAVRARYDEAQWLNLAKPLRDVLREKQRAALVAYLISHLKLPRNVRDANDLYAHFLLDVEMAPCMMTSRIKQALSSVQLFVQRCLMNLEPDVKASTELDEKWREWKWMKNYRVWEANRKVFLYPENWIEPELRDGKSPFFVELESELLQSDLTLDTAEEAFLHYLEKLDQVAHLEVAAIYHQLEKDAAGNDAVDVLHVFARTPATTHVYYYRQRVDSAFWTAWERLDLDIEGEHLIPVVWNRRLHLFWPIFIEKAAPLTVSFSGGSLSGTEPQKYWEIKLAWSERKQGTWTNKRVSTEAISQVYFSPGSLDKPSAFQFRTQIGPDGSLKVWGPFSSSPFFKPGFYLRRAFHFEGCHSEPGVTEGWNRWEQTLTGTRFDRMFYKEDGNRRLFLPAPSDTEALAKTPGTFLLLPYADGSSLRQHPFFYRDDRRTFFVIPSEVQVWDWSGLSLLDPYIAMNAAEYYWEGVAAVLDPTAIFVEPEDPRFFSPSFVAGPEVGRFELDTDVLSGNLGGGVFLAPESGAALPAMFGTPSLALSSGRAVAMSIPLTAELDLMPANNFSLVSTSNFNWQWYTFHTENRFQFQTFYHPFVCAFVHELNRNGVAGLLQRRMQTHPRDFVPQPVPPQLDFKKDYEPGPIVIKPYPDEEEVDFGEDGVSEDGAYALYNWELFFHAPLMIADRLSKNQRYEEAQKWFHSIFDPTDTSGLGAPQRYWRTKPFFKRTREGYQRERIQTVLGLLAAGADPQREAQLSPEQRMDLKRFRKTVERWRKDPFKPHLIARMRTTAYQKTVVMKYLDNLIGWADQLFRRDTIESINEATQLYVLAAEILGRRPEDVPPRANPRVQTFNSLEPALDDFSNALVQIEEFLSPSADAGAVVESSRQPRLTLPAMLYFCVPRNDKLLAYWDTVADRLFKIRHCMNIEGVVRQLPLFEPPIEPGLLVKAAAAGVDLGSVLNDVSAGPPHYRFNVLSQKATELCGELKSLGQAMLSALEKRDAERLALLRSQHEAALLVLVEEVRKLQVEEAEQNKTALSRSRDTAVTRYTHYQRLLGVQSPQVPGIGEPIAEGSPSPHAAIQEEGGVKVTSFEKGEMQSLGQAHLFQQLASGLDLAANIAHLVPNANIEPWGVGITYGGSDVGKALSAYASYFRIISTQLSYEASRSGKLGQYALRSHDWLLQSNLAAREIMQIDQQYLAADLRKQITEKELANHRRQIENAREVEEFLRDKYTNQELYGWMIGQLATLYFQTYQLAYDLAKRAERAFRHELALRDSSFIQFGYWDSLKKGLLAGERLFHDIKRMEVAYLDQHRREYEITKQISLARLDPLALIKLRETGTCLVSIPEAFFDLDFPGHYLRRIKSVSVSIPCVTGPHTGVNCTLTLLRSSVRHGNTLSSGKYGRLEGDSRFTDSLGAIQSIATSNAQNDSGLFEPNLRDERFLPFEGAGAISEWQIELPAGFRQFDYDTIADVVLHMRYTAREGGGPLRQQATVELQNALDELIRTEGQQGLAQILSVRHELPAAWHGFLNPSAEAGPVRTLALDLGEERFPFLFARRKLKITSIELFIKVNDGFAETHGESTLKLALEAGVGAPGPEDGEENDFLSLVTWNGLLRAGKGFDKPPGLWTLNVWLDGEDVLDPKAFRDVLLVCRYTCS